MHTCTHSHKDTVAREESISMSAKLYNDVENRCWIECTHTSLCSNTKLSSEMVECRTRSWEKWMLFCSPSIFRMRTGVLLLSIQRKRKSSSCPSPPLTLRCCQANALFVNSYNKLMKPVSPSYLCHTLCYNVCTSIFFQRS